jgi:hypothetical protein
MADDLSWWELYKQDLLDEFKKVKGIATGVAKASVNADEHYNNLVALWDRAKADWDEITKGRDLDAVRVNGRKLTSYVIILRDAEDVLEDFRLEDLKDTLTENYQAVKDAINEIQTGSELPPAEDVPVTAQIMVRISDIFTQVEKIADAILNVVEKFNLITGMQKSMEKKFLTQGNPRERIEDPSGFHYSRRLT